MFLFHKPTAAEINNFLRRQGPSAFSYFGPGSSVHGKAPAGYTVDHSRVQLGSGEDVWEKAVNAIRGWEMFNVGWIQLCWPNVPLTVGANVATVIEHFRFYSLNASRIVYTVDEDGPVKRFGFAYGTLKEHSESGEERFLVEWIRESNVVSYDLFAFSKPGNLVVRALQPVARQLQRRFANESLDAMKRAVKATSATPASA
jgi:uncharacterized protein (UPF0548 family)